MDALYITGQENSYPNILASKFALTQETDGFTQPLMNDNTGGFLLSGNQITENRFVLACGCYWTTARPARYTGASPTTEVVTKLSGPFNNMGVPGAKSYHLVAPGLRKCCRSSCRNGKSIFRKICKFRNATVLRCIGAGSYFLYLVDWK